MTKGNLVATSLVGALPAAGLAYLTIMAFINYADRMATMLQVVTGTALLCSVLMALSPFAILLFTKSGTAAEASPAPAAAGKSSKPEQSEEAEAAPEGEALEDDAFGEAAPGSGTDDEDMSLSGFDESVDETSAASEEDFEFDDDGFEFDDEEKK